MFYEDRINERIPREGTGVLPQRSDRVLRGHARVLLGRVAPLLCFDDLASLTHGDRARPPGDREASGGGCVPLRRRHARAPRLRRRAAGNHRSRLRHQREALRERRAHPGGARAVRSARRLEDVLLQAQPAQGPQGLRGRLLPDQPGRRARLLHRRHRRESDGAPECRHLRAGSLREGGKVPGDLPRVLRARSPGHGRSDRGHAMIQKDLRAIILIELLLPLLLTLFGVYHGVLQVLYRAGIIQDVSFGGIGYYQGLTAHGVINAIVLTTFFAVAFGHAVISQYLDHGVSKTGAWTGFVLMVGGTLVAAYPIFTGRANVLYTFYAPMKAHPLFYFGVVFLVVGSWVSFWSWIPGYLRWRKSHPGRKTPLAAVGMFSAFIIWQICTLPVAYEVIVQLIPWSLGWTPGVNVVLSRLLFWFFGHPLVYFWLLPAYVMYYTIMPRLAGGKLYSDFYGRFVFMAFIVLSSPLGLHHQFTEPAISSGYKALHASLTFLVAVPSLVTAFTLAASLEYGARQNGGKGLFAWWA